MPGSWLAPVPGVIVTPVTTWSQYYPKTLGQYDCNPQYLFHISSADRGTTLGPDPISTKFLTPNMIKPQTYNSWRAGNAASAFEPDGLVALVPPSRRTPALAPAKP